jgi:hypothetical protein
VIFNFSQFPFFILRYVTFWWGKASSATKKC